MSDTPSAISADPEVVEARCRRLMSLVPQARGWDGERERANVIAECDAAFDEWLELTRA